MEAGDASGVWVVAGCLFEVSLPMCGTGSWRWANPGPEATLLAEDLHETGRRHFRFRAEAAAAEAGQVHLAFQSSGGDSCRVSVLVAPESTPGAAGDRGRARREGE